MALACAGFGLGWWLKPNPRLNAITYGGERTIVINAQLSQVAKPYGFLAGDSLMERYLTEPLPCGLQIVNGGINGAKVADYLTLLKRVHFDTRPVAVLLTTGLNDLLDKHAPRSEATVGRYREDVERLVWDLAQGGAKVTVAAIPPVDVSLARYFDTAAFRVYSDELKGICGRIGCTFVDPFAEMRTEEFWKAKPGASRDGLHVDDLRAAYRPVVRSFCG